MRSIATAVLAPSKVKWEKILQEYLGEDFVMISSYSLGATHLAVFAHISLAPIISNVESECIATGIKNIVGNKGAVGIRFKIGKTSILCISSHLAAGEFKVEKRNEDFKKIYKKIVLREKEEPTEEVGCMGRSSKKTSLVNPVFKKNVVVALHDSGIERSESN